MRYSVYFAQSPQTGLIKIGVTRYEPRIRVANIYPRPVLLASIAVETASWENSFHERFLRLHEFGEWFRPEPDLLDAIRRMIQIGKFDFDQLPPPTSPRVLAVKLWAQRKAAMARAA